MRLESDARYCITAGFLVLLAVLVMGPAGLSWGQEPLMVEKNLFSPERKAVESKPAEPTGEAPKMPKGAIQLDGVFVHGDVKKAILRVNPSLLKNSKNKADPFVTVGENEQLGDYKIAKIEPRSISVETRGSTFVVPLFVAGKVAPPPPKPVSAAPNTPPAQAARPPVPGQTVPGAANAHQQSMHANPGGDPGNPMAMGGNPGGLQLPPGSQAPPDEGEDPDDGPEAE
jgi:hypothetical protein